MPAAPTHRDNLRLFLASSYKLGTCFMTSCYNLAMHCSAHTALRLCLQLFKFTNLLGFSLTFKDGFYAHSLHLPSRGGSDASKSDLTLGLADQESESEPVFARLWDMLTLRCPDLESLRIVGNSSEPSDAARLYTAHWPNLRHVTLGALVWTTTSMPGQGQTTSSFKEFLERHPTIESLHLLGRPSSNQVDLSTLSPDALPNLKEFSGSFALLRMLVDRTDPEDVAAAGGNVQQGQPQPQVQNPTPNQQSPPVPTTRLSKTLQRVCFPHAMQLRDLTPLAISRVLLGLHALMSIKVTFAIQGGYDSNGVFRTLVASCPHLLEMDITCVNRPSFFLVRKRAYSHRRPRLISRTCSRMRSRTRSGDYHDFVRCPLRSSACRAKSRCISARPALPWRTLASSRSASRSSPRRAPRTP